MQPTTIAAWETGLKDDVRPYLNPQDGLVRFENAYVFRGRVQKRYGLRFLGRLRRVLADYAFFLTPAANTWTFSLKVISGFITAANNANPGQITTSSPHGLSNGDLVAVSQVLGAVGYNTNSPYTVTVVDATNFTIGLNAAAYGAYTGGGVFISNRALTSEPNAEIEPGSFNFVIDNGGANHTVITDVNLTGVLSPGVPNNLGFTTGNINYITGSVTLNFAAPIPGGLTTILDYNYYPSLPVMGIHQRELAAINEEETIFFDTKYAYNYTTGFQEWIPGTTWDGADNDFFWATNFRGVNPENRLFFTSNFNNTSGSPMRYSDGGSWTTFAPQINATPNYLFQAAILIPYYGRLLALNCTEGPNIAGAVNIFNRCRFSQIGSPVQSDAYREDIPGKGGFLDAPTNEAIIGATFNKNTLIVEFERSHWELRYVGEYGLPFIWERVSADFGSESRFSGVTFDEASLVVGSTAIIAANANGVARIDENIPDTVFNIRNAEEGTERVIGIRDYQKELVYWSYTDSNFQETTTQVYPQKVLIYNYRNQSFSQFRQNTTFFGTFQSQEGISWSSTSVLWDDETVFWTDPTAQSLFPSVICGNQQGYIHYFNEQIPDDMSQTITAIDRTVTPPVITSPNHNYVTGEIIQINGMLFVDTTTNLTVTTDLNGRIFRVNYLTDNTFSISEWDGDNYANNFSYTPPSGSGTYMGGGQITLLPNMIIETKDFNPWMMELKQVKLIRIDFLLDVTQSANVTVLCYPSSSSSSAEGFIGNFQVETYNPSTSPSALQYLWHRYYIGMYGQFARIRLTYSDALMNDINTHSQDFVLNAMTLWMRPGGTGVAQ